MFKSGFIFTVLLLGFATSYPASEKDLSDVDFDPFDGQEPIVDTGYFGSYYPSLDGFYKRLQDVISSIRQRIAGDETSFSEAFGDLGKGNTTSYTKIIGNHKVEVNETEYKKDTDFGTSHVKVSYINVRPLNPDPDTIETATPEPDTETIQKSKDRESLEDSQENEITNADEGGAFNIETFDVANDNNVNANNNNNKDDSREIEFVEESPVPYRKPIYSSIFSDASNDIDYKNTYNNEVRDLSNDVYVNDLMLADGAPLNPDAEFI